MSRHQHHHHNKDSQQEPRAKPFHRSWLFIVAVILMLIGIVAYVLSIDESVDSIPVPVESATSAP